MAPFATLRLQGADLTTFLHNQTTFNTRELPVGEFHLVSWLDPQGRLESYGWLLKEASACRLLVPPVLLRPTLERLERFLVSEDVEIIQEGERDWLFILGPAGGPTAASFRGELFNEPALLEQGPLRSELPVLSNEQVALARGLSGWPHLDAKDFKKELINNLRLYDLSVSTNKGCYPGQETVAKIATRRGAAYYPVLLECNQLPPTGAISVQDKKIGELLESYLWQDKYYLAAHLIRDFRVEGMKISFTDSNGGQHSGIVRYYPLLPGDNEAKAQELFFSAMEHFKHDRLTQAKQELKLAIELSPQYADAYEGLGVILGREENFQEALEYMQKLSQVDAASVLAHTNMSLYLMRLGRIEEAEEQKSLATVKSFQQFGQEAKLKEVADAQKQQKAQEWQQRESMFLQVLEIDPEDTLANYGIGSIAVEKGDWQRAQQHLCKVLEQDPNYSVAYLALGKAYQGLGQPEDARQTFRQGIIVAAKKGDLMPANQMQLELDQLS
jgi:folate-binding protein YgfZ